MAFLKRSIAISYILMVMTSIRIPGIPLGVGEILMLFSIIVLLFRHKENDEKQLNSFHQFSVLNSYWTLFFISLFCGAIINLLEVDRTISYTTLFAYIFNWFIIYIMVQRLTIDDVIDIVRYLAVYGTIFYFVLYLYSVNISRYLFSIPLYYSGGARFSGGAKNPNQLALFFSMMPFISAYFMKSCFLNKKITRGIGWAFVCCGGILIGIKCNSDAIIGAWTIGLAFFCYRLSFKWIHNTLVKISIIFFAVIFIFLVFHNEIFNRFERWFNDLDAGGSRQILWYEGWKASKDSFLIGFGPGSFCGPTQAEAHNTIIDFLTQGGLLAVTALMILFYHVYASAANDIILSSAVIALILYSMGHFVGRQPVFYFYLLFGMAAGIKDSKIKQSLDESRHKYLRH